MVEDRAVAARATAAEERPLALVTGGSRGIGEAVVLTLARDGFDVWLTCLSSPRRADDVAARAGEAGARCRVLELDVGDPEAIADVVGGALGRRPLNALVANAGEALRGPLLRLGDDELRRQVAVNLESFLVLVRVALRSLVRAGGARVVALSSTAGRLGLPGQAAYSAAKAGLLGAVGSLSRELAPHGILVNAVAPGFIDTDMNAGLGADERPDFPLGRPGTAAEVAEVVAFLCSPRSSYVSGAVVPVTGGLPG